KTFTASFTYMSLFKLLNQRLRLFCCTVSFLINASSLGNDLKVKLFWYFFRTLNFFDCSSSCFDRAIYSSYCNGKELSSCCSFTHCALSFNSLNSLLAATRCLLFSIIGAKLKSKVV